MDTTVNHAPGPYNLDIKTPIGKCKSRVVKFKVCFEYMGTQPEECFAPGITSLVFRSGSCFKVLYPNVYAHVSGVPSTEEGTNSIAMQVSPNPVSNTLRLDLVRPVKGGVVRLLSLDGHDVLRKPLDHGTAYSTIELDITTVPSGQYIVVVEGDNRVLQHAVTIAH